MIRVNNQVSSELAQAYMIYSVVGLALGSLLFAILSCCCCCCWEKAKNHGAETVTYVEHAPMYEVGGGADVEIEFEVEAPCVEIEVEIEAPAFEVEVEIEAPEIEIEVEAGPISHRARQVPISSHCKEGAARP